MNHHKEICDPALISRFIDHELDPEEYGRVAGHIETCPLCRRTFQEMSRLSAMVNTQIHSLQPEAIEGSLEEKILSSLQKRKPPWRLKTGEILLSKKILIPLTTAVALILFLSVFFHSSTPAGPSAIVTSLSGTMTSVFIMETPETRQTILWFNENSTPERQKL